MVKVFRNRYLVFKVYTEKEPALDEEDIKQTLFNTARTLFGEAWMAKLDLQLINFNPSTLEGILKCGHKTVTETRAIIATITSLKKEPVSLYVKGVSGTLKRARKKFTEKEAREDNNRKKEA
ncbi:MAG: Rpp14/Pop5 family protein [Candidatus Wukongarchaeota archaeon]|nr:Rpp14/Pop5 family protein [Candidatus Wukongarchaeota archaeon]